MCREAKWITQVRLPHFHSSGKPELPLDRDLLRVTISGHIYLYLFLYLYCFNTDFGAFSPPQVKDLAIIPWDFNSLPIY
jgi:hypothetical protein